jgi:hypothetical protein
MPSVDDCRLIDIASHRDKRGDLTVVEALPDLGFCVERAYWLYGTPSGAHRAGHAHRQLRQCYVAVAGSMTVALDDGGSTRDVRLDRPDQGLLIGPGLWRDLSDFSPGAVLLVLASAAFDESDYIRDHAAFLAEYGHGRR